MAKYDITIQLIDMDKFVKAMIDYSKDKNINYIIMNEVTYSKFLHCSIKQLWEENWNGRGLSYITFKNIPIAVCNSLETGDIELI